MQFTLDDQKNYRITHNPYNFEKELKAAFLIAANEHLKMAQDYVLRNPNAPANWFEIQGRIEVEVQDLKNQICKQSAYLSFKELQDLSHKVFVLSVLAKKLLTISNQVAA